jgi:hypothetical protein
MIRSESAAFIVKLKDFCVEDFSPKTSKFTKIQVRPQKIFNPKMETDSFTHHKFIFQMAYR